MAADVRRVGIRGIVGGVVLVAAVAVVAFVALGRSNSNGEDLTSSAGADPAGHVTNVVRDAAGSGALPGTWTARNAGMTFRCIGNALPAGPGEAPRATTASGCPAPALTWMDANALTIEPDGTVSELAGTFGGSTDADPFEWSCTGQADVGDDRLQVIDLTCDGAPTEVGDVSDEVGFELAGDCLTIIDGSGGERSFEREGGGTCALEPDAAEKFMDIGEAIASAD